MEGELTNEGRVLPGCCMRSRRLPRSVISLDTTLGNLSLMELMRPPGILAISVSLTHEKRVLMED